MNKPPLSIIILLSGNGSNLHAIIDAIKNKNLNAKIKAVISDNAKAFGLIRAKKANIATHVVEPTFYQTKTDFDQALVNIILPYQPKLIVLAGFMRILTPQFVNAFPNKIINIHPSLLPKYKGLNTYQRALDNKEKFHGTTVHLVNHDLDNGQIISQAKCKILPNDTVLTLKNRVQALEHQIYPEVIQLFAENMLLETVD